MELENIIITSKKPEYKENETLNFLLIFVCYVHDFVSSMVRLSNGIGMHFKQNRGEKIVVHFCQDYIVVLLHCGCLSLNPFIEFSIRNNSSSSDVLYIQASISISPKYESK